MNNFIRQLFCTGGTGGGIGAWRAHVHGTHADDLKHKQKTAVERSRGRTERLWYSRQPSYSVNRPHVVG